MPIARLLVLTTVLAVTPLAAAAQTTAPQTTTVPQTVAAQPAPPPVQTTQDVTVKEPNLQALTPTRPTTDGKPRWSEFPKVPKNVPTVADFAGRVRKEEADSGVIDAIGRSIVWEKYQPDAIAADANARIDPAKLAPVDPELTPAQTEALAQSLRDQVTPPPLAQ